MKKARNYIKEIAKRILDKIKHKNSNLNALPSRIDKYIEKNIDNMQQFCENNKNSTNGRTITSNLLKSLNYDKIPKNVNSKEFGSLAANSKYGIIYRGISADTPEQAKEYVKQFKEGPLYVGGTNASIKGAGIYTCYGDNKAAMDYSTNGGHTSNSKIIEMVLDETANVVDYDKLVEEQNKSLNTMSKQFSKYDKSITDLDSLSQNIDKISDKTDLKKATFLSKVLNNAGHYAAVNGYDAIDVADKKYLIILNRGKVICKDEEKNINKESNSKDVNEKASVLNQTKSINSKETDKNEFIADLKRKSYSQNEIADNCSKQQEKSSQHIQEKSELQQNSQIKTAPKSGIVL